MSLDVQCKSLTGFSVAGAFNVPEVPDFGLREAPRAENLFEEPAGSADSSAAACAIANHKSQIANPVTL